MELLGPVGERGKGECGRIEIDGSVAVEPAIRERIADHVAAGAEVRRAGVTGGRGLAVVTEQVGLYGAPLTTEEDAG